MPLYEYQCKKCKHRFEKIQKFSDREVKKCPECGGPVEKLISASAVQFKGTGWYVTDYAKKSGSSGPSSSSSDSSSDGESSKSDSSKEKDKDSGKKDKEKDSKPKAESKPESKSESKKTEKKSS